MTADCLDVVEVAPEQVHCQVRLGTPSDRKGINRQGGPHGGRLSDKDRTIQLAAESSRFLAVRSSRVPRVKQARRCARGRGDAAIVARWAHRGIEVLGEIIDARMW